MTNASREGKALFTFVSQCLVCALVLEVDLHSAHCQEPTFFYYSDSRKIGLTVSRDWMALRFERGVTLEEQRTIVESEGYFGPFSWREELPIVKLVLLPLREHLTEVDIIEVVNRLNRLAGIEFANPVFTHAGSRLIMADEFNVRFTASISEAEIQAFNERSGVEVARKTERTDFYVLRVKNPTNMNTLKIANVYYQSPITVFSVPNFARSIETGLIPNDEYFPQQWPLHNTGQDPPGGTAGADMNAPEGWERSTGPERLREDQWSAIQAKQ